tara:strand:+ start:742 stop:906 length:165 start_codon:yes stop_codon:yes gene_type:complete
MSDEGWAAGRLLRDGGWPALLGASLGKIVKRGKKSPEERVFSIKKSCFSVRRGL